MIADRNRRQRRKPGRRGGGATCPSVASLGDYAGFDRLVAFQRGELNANKDGITGTPASEEDWALDMTGNWPGLVQKTSGSTDLDQGRTHNPVNEITAITATTGTDWADPVHDRAGNMTTIPKPANLADGLNATYDAWNRLVEVKDGQNVIARYDYDGLNRRIKSHIDSGAPSSPTGLDTYVHYYYNSAWQILETRETDTPSAAPETLQPKHQYVWSQRYIDAAVLRDENTGTNGLCDDQRLYYLNDANFNVTALLDTSGNAVERYVYRPYGVATIYDATWTNPRSVSSYANATLYTGRELDPETGLYYYRNRYFSAELGRFGSRDPVGFRGNRWGLYEYVDGHPLNLLDPFGQQPQTDIKPTGDPPSDGGQKGWPFPKCNKNCHGFCFQLKNYGKLTNCTITKMEASEGCSPRISAAITTFRRADKVPFVKGPCQTLEAWLTDSRHIMTKPFSSCRGKGGETCDCTNRRPFQGSPFTLTINHTIPLEQFIPSPIPPYFIENVPVDLTDPKILTEIRQCDVIVDASITLSNANGWIGQCTQRKN